MVKTSLPSHTWHPCMQMKDFETMPPIEIASASGDYLITQSGQKIIDGISSWWCKSLGHQHPQLMQALRRQSEAFEHVILANTTNAPISQLSDNLCHLAPSFDRVFYASEGSSAVEIALKMAVHGQSLRGFGQRTQLIALANGYHGETCLALSVSDVGLYSEPYQALLQPVTFINDLPYINGCHDPLWHDCSEVWPAIEKQLQPLAETAAALILEPILQGAGGMKIYSADLLKRLRQWCRENHCFFIADEIMTGFGRTGTMLACDHAEIEPDMLCVSKGLTGGVLPLSAVVTTDEIYQLFYDDYESGKAFLHSHTYSGNALAVAVANELFAVYREQAILERLPALTQKLSTLMQAVADETGVLTNLRVLGGMAAADIAIPNMPKRIGYQLHCEALRQGALLRPLGNSLYWLPPLNSRDDSLARLAEITQSAVKKCTEALI